MKSKEEIDRNGYCCMGRVLSENDVLWFESDLLNRLPSDNDIVQTMFKFDQKYISLIENPIINDFVNQTLNNRAILQDVYGLANLMGNNTDLTRNRFHRDMPWLPFTRICVMIFIALTDIDEQNGATEIIPCSHLLRDEPSEDFANRNKRQVKLKAGEAFAIDATLWHKAGINHTKNPRTMLLLKYSLAFIKQPVDLYRLYEEKLAEASEIVKIRMGWYTSENHWKPGNYVMENSYVI